MQKIKVELDILEFVKTGKFGFLKLGESKEEIINQGFPPEDWLNKQTIASSAIWRYGNIELHFDDSNHLSGIFTDYVTNIDGGESISIINWWILPNGKASPNLLDTIQELNNLNIDFSKTTFEVGCVEIKLFNGVYFMFDCLDDELSNRQNKWTMTVIGKK